MDTDPTTEPRRKHSCPDILHTRPEPEVKRLVVAAKKEGRFGTNWNVILNNCLRTLLTPIYGTKQQKEKMGVEV